MQLISEDNIRRKKTGNRCHFITITVADSTYRRSFSLRFLADTPVCTEGNFIVSFLNVSFLISSFCFLNETGVFCMHNSASGVNFCGTILIRELFSSGGKNR